VRRSNAPAEPKFRREPPDARREELIDATLACLKKLGHDGVSVRQISAEAGVSMGLINHHFHGIDALLAAAYESLAKRLLSRSRDPALFRIWLVFWSLVPHAPKLRAVRERTYAETRATLETLLTHLKRVPGVPPFKVSSAAIGLSALMDGLWVELSLNPSSFAASEAVSLCDDWIHALAAGAFPALRVSQRGKMT